jgi:hypothetical protein
MGATLTHAGLVALLRLSRSNDGEIDTSKPGSSRPSDASRSACSAPATHAVRSDSTCRWRTRVDRAVSTDPEHAVVAEGQQLAQDRVGQVRKRRGRGLANNHTHVRIDLWFDDGWLEVNVTNPTFFGTSQRVAGGYGLIGMRERATLLGGSLDAERVNGVFRVRARLAYYGAKQSSSASQGRLLALPRRSLLPALPGSTKRQRAARRAALH